MSTLYHTFFYDPLYNTLIALFDILPWADAGIVVIVLTVLVRFILYPLSKKAVITQIKMKEIAPELKEIKNKYKTPEEQARKTLELYKTSGVNPFSGVFVILIQLPIIWALYQIFLHALPAVDPEVLYSFVKVPDAINTTFLGWIDITKKNAILAFLAAATTYFQIKIATQNQPQPTGDNSFGDNLARSMQVQMKFIFPVLVFFISFSISGVIALYWLTTNLFTIGQELLVMKKFKSAQV